MGMDEIIRNRAIVSKLLVLETITVMLTGFIVFILSSLEFTYSVILGGFAYILPNAIFAKLSLKISATKNPALRAGLKNNSGAKHRDKAGLNN